MENPNSYFHEQIIQFKVNFRSPQDIEPISECDEQWSRELISSFMRTCLGACLFFRERKVSFVLTEKNLFLVSKDG
jgi:hypothetical protein